jgi:hypothetical protein
MTRVRDKQLFSLSEFYKAHWAPILESLNEPGNDELEEFYILCKWIDAVGWVNLGADLAIYDVEASKNLLSSGRLKLKALYERHSKDLSSVIPGYVLTRIEELINSGDISPEAFSDPIEDLHPYFFTGESLSQLWNQDALMLWFRRAVLTRANEWPAGPISPEALTRLLWESDSPTEVFTLEEAVVGSIRCVNAMAMWNDLSRGLRLAERVPIDNREHLKRRMGEFNGWRFGFDKSNVNKKLTYLGELLRYIFLDSGQSQMGLSFDSQILAHNIENVIDEWHNDHPFYLSHGASG